MLLKVTAPCAENPREKIVTIFSAVNTAFSPPGFNLWFRRLAYATMVSVSSVVAVSILVLVDRYLQLTAIEL